MLAAIGALMLLTSLFLDWFKPDLSAWTTFEIVDLLLAALALAILYAVAERLRRGAAPGDGTAVAGWPAAAAALALVLVVATLVNHPPATIGVAVKVGIWIALGGAVLMVAGTLLERAGVSFSFSVSRPEPAGAASPPEQREPAGDTQTRPISGR